MITCNRCGKENQDHYKFCLGCGNEIRAAKPAAAAAAVVATAVTEPPPPAPPSLPSLEDVLLAPPAAAPPAGGFAMAATMLPPAPDAFSLAPPPAVAPPVELNRPLPGMPSPTAAAPTPASKPSGGIPWGDSPRMPVKAAGAAPAMAATPPPVAAPVAAPKPAAAAPAPAAAATSKCPSCGADVKAGFAFCGTCGTRVAAPPAGGAKAAPAVVPAVADIPAVMHLATPPLATPPLATPPVAAAPQPRGRLVLIRPDGSEGGNHPLHGGENLIGRGQGPLFDADAYLSPRHAEFVVEGSSLTVRDLRSLNGVFVKITQEEPLVSGDIFRIGQELLRFDVIAPPVPLEDGTDIMGTPNPGYWGRLSVIVGRDVDGSAFPVFGEALVLGRERGDIIFPEDGYVSGAHARISLREAEGGHQPILADLGSSNGTFLRIRGERTLGAGAFLLMGQQLFRVELR